MTFAHIGGPAPRRAKGTPANPKRTKIALLSSGTCTHATYLCQTLTKVLRIDITHAAKRVPPVDPTAPTPGHSGPNHSDVNVANVASKFMHALVITTDQLLMTYLAMQGD